MSGILNKEKQPLRLLSLDGGGIRGYSELLILQEVLRKTAERHQEAGLDVNNFKPFQYFDLIGGTSTGGLLGLMLGRLEMSVSECLESYATLSTEVFGNPTHLPWQKYSAAGLRRATEKLLQRCSLPPDEPLVPASTSRTLCKTFVTTYDPNHNKLLLLRTYEARPAPLTIVDAVMATAAASSYFPAWKLGTLEVIDAARDGFNNPGVLVLDEARRIWPAHHPLNSILSLGTGARYPPIFSWRPQRFKEYMKTRLTDTESVVRELDARCRALCPSYYGRVYYRLNVSTGLEGVKLDDYKKIDIIRTATQSYLVSQNVVDLVDEYSKQHTLSHFAESRLYGSIPRTFCSSGNGRDIQCLLDTDNTAYGSQRLRIDAQSLPYMAQNMKKELCFLQEAIQVVNTTKTTTYTPGSRLRWQAQEALRQAERNVEDVVMIQNKGIYASGDVYGPLAKEIFVSFHLLIAIRKILRFDATVLAEMEETFIYWFRMDEWRRDFGDGARSPSLCWQYSLTGHASRESGPRSVILH